MNAGRAAPTDHPAPLDGILLVDKPSGPTSADVVRAVKRRHRLSSAGHLGTLDPMATGLLPLCIGSGTKLAQFLSGDRKSYAGTIKLGIATDTLDLTGAVIERGEVPRLEEAVLAGVAASLTGTLRQTPPMYSAVKHRGVALYKLARAGLDVERQAREIHVAELLLSPVAGEPDQLAFDVTCSKGTYVRALAAEVGRALGTVASLASLRRTRFGHFSLDQATALADLLELDTSRLPVIAPRRALEPMRELAVPPEVAFALAAGQRSALGGFEPPRSSERFASVVAPNGQLLAVLEATDGAWRLARVLMPEATQLYRP